ncbi:hypothetical protein D0B54_11225 [Solimonas sp. K1W22B-7]|nr:hypothetical protein D0B54_11225 [Solimonas sp. K1W22B-7]
MIRDHALCRLAEIFKVPLESLRPFHRFDVDLKSSFVSDFRRNELDKVSDDIHDVADKHIMKEFASDKTVIGTVEDYCNHMIRCGKLNPKEVERLLGVKIEN